METAPFDYTAQIILPTCTVCGRRCAVDWFPFRWQVRLEQTCAEFALVATELLAARARTCEEWTDWKRQGTRCLERTLSHSPLHQAASRLIAATTKLIHRHAGGDDIPQLCQTMRAHGPAEGDPVRMLRAARPTNEDRPRWAWRNVSWIRCANHGLWCAVGQHRDIFAHYERKRQILAAHFIAAHSRSCDDFRLRQKIAASTEHPTRFVPAARGRWIRRDQPEGDRITLISSATEWSHLAPALGSWQAVTAEALQRQAGT